MALSPPPCSGLGRHCRSLSATLRIGSLEEGSTSLDHEATWLLGHTEQISFGELWKGDGDLYVDAVLHVPCRYLASENGRARCQAYGFVGPMPRDPRTAQPRRLGGDRFRVVDDCKSVARTLAWPPRSLPVLSPTNGSMEANPCAEASCRTADNTRGAACCRDLQVEIMCTKGKGRLEALVRSRRSPYMCKVTRPGNYSLEVEMISACGYLEDEGVACSLHGRARADGRPAKPDLCSDWPPRGQTLHTGCVFARRSRGRRPALRSKPSVQDG
jgi:hypothetical protein